MLSEIMYNCFRGGLALLLILLFVYTVVEVIKAIRKLCGYYSGCIRWVVLLFIVYSVYFLMCS